MTPDGGPSPDGSASLGHLSPFGAGGHLVAQVVTDPKPQHEAQLCHLPSESEWAAVTWMSPSSH